MQIASVFVRFCIYMQIKKCIMGLSHSSACSFFLTKKPIWVKFSGKVSYDAETTCFDFIPTSLPS